MKKRIAFDLDETLGCPIIQNNAIKGFSIRTGCVALLTKLIEQYDLVLWTVSNKGYVKKVVAFGLEQYFSKFITWDDLPERWKDVRKVDVAYLIDDSEYHRECGKQYGIDAHYIIVPSFGSPEDQQDPLLWIKRIEQVLL